MNSRIFTPAEARRTLPLVRVIIRDIMADHAALDWLREQRRSGRLNRVSLDRRRDEVERGLAEHCGELEALGCYLEDGPRGIVAYPCFIGNELVYLSWRWDEGDVSFYHRVKESFTRRRPIPEAACRPRTTSV